MASQYQCKCENHASTGYCKFRAFSGCSTSAQKGAEVKVGLLMSDSLDLLQQNNNMVKIEVYYVAGYEGVGCYTVNSGDTVDVSGGRGDYTVYINGKVVQPCMSSDDCGSV